MARPLPANSAPRNGSHASVPSLAANLALAAAVDDELAPEGPGWEEGAAAPPADAPARETAALREQLTETERLLGELRKEAEQALAEQQAEFERILEEKSELIRQ